MAFHIHRAMRTDTDLLAGGLGALLRNGAFAGPACSVSGPDTPALALYNAVLGQGNGGRRVNAVA